MSQIPSLSVQLGQLPNINKDRFIASFVKEQKTHAKSYASQGRSPVSTSSLPPQVSAQYGFDTPILKARSSKTIQLLSSRPALEPPANLESPQRAKNIKKRIVKPPPSPPAQKKRRSAENSEEEHAARLAERRERKRTKRAIVNPVDKENGDDEEDDDISSKPKAKGKTRLASKKDKVPPGLALMHGFAASNVGKNRLTARLPPPSFGVFNRGRASEKTTVSSKKQDKKGPIHFSEFRFLNAQQDMKSAKIRRREPSPSDSESSSIRVVSAPKNHHLRLDKRPIVKKKRSPPTELSTTDAEGIAVKNVPSKSRSKKEIRPIDPPSDGSESDGDAPPASKRRIKKHCHEPQLVVDEADVPDPQTISQVNGLKSEVWDIERSDFVLSSKASSVVIAKESVVLDTRPTAWASHINKRNGEDTHSDIPHFDNPASEARIPSSPSLGPSQSASQQGQRQLRFKYPSAHVSSKYFPLPVPNTVKQDTIPDHPRTLPLSAQVLKSAIPTSDIPDILLQDSDSVIDLPMHAREDRYTYLGVFDEDTAPWEDDPIRADPTYDETRNYADDISGYYEDDVQVPLNFEEELSWNEMDCPALDDVYQQDIDVGEAFDDYFYPASEAPIEDFQYAQVDEDVHQVAIDDDVNDMDYGDFDNDQENYYEESGMATLLPDRVYEIEPGGSSDESDSDQPGLQRFLGGRELLCGLTEETPSKWVMGRPSTSAEAQVAKTIRGHWLPQRL
ncbi:hypothetical protein BDZ89DRAFT_1055777 [Hymenopellis radicata]|nr:hypothetical protein BDZ89DRAFT_1055777 [Hymenopellis radicata]